MGVSCSVSCSIVGCLCVGFDILVTRLGKRKLLSLLLFTCNYVVSVQRGFFFLLVLGIGCIILLHI